MTDFFPQKTTPYKTFVKNTIVGALGDVFKNHRDPDLQRTRVTLEYPRTKEDYPAVVIRFFERDIFNAGIGHQEYVREDGETRGSDDLQLQVPGGGVQLTWSDVPSAFRYHIYRRDTLGNNRVFVTTKTQFADYGSGKGSDGRARNTSTTGALVPAPTATLTPQGNLPAGTYFYRVSAVAPGRVWKFKHYMYTGDFEFAIYALSNYDRDLISDSIVQTLGMGSLEAYTQRFFDRLYPNPETDAFPAADLHFLNLNTDRMQGFGETEQPVKWGQEDSLLYMSSYRVGAMGEFYNLPPDFPWALVSQVTEYPYIGGIEPIPEGDPDDTTEWESSAGI